MLGLKVLAVTALSLWLAHARGRLAALSLGLIIGGAVGNGIDRLAYGWVADFVFFHVSTVNWRFNWYVFNLADVAIVAGVIGLLYESLILDRAVKAP
jgi:signal peptidase II